MDHSSCIAQVPPHHNTSGLGMGIRKVHVNLPTILFCKILSTIQIQVTDLITSQILVSDLLNCVVNWNLHEIHLDNLIFNRCKKYCMR